MTGRLVCVVITPCRDEGGWRAALRRAAAIADWDYRDYWGEGDQPVDPSRPTLVVTLNEATLGALVVTDWVALTAPPAEVLARSKSQFDLDDAAALLHAASRLTTASFLGQVGAALYQTSAPAIDIPGLGSVSRSQDAAQPTLPAVQDDAVSALRIFDQVPPPVGASAFWPASIFSRFDDPTPGAAAQTIDLTGRGRILIHGPYLSIPAGRWRVTFDFEFEIPVGSAPFRFEWGEVADVVFHDARARESGRYSISLERDWPATGRAEVRVWLYHAVFQGDFRLIGCTVERLSEAGLTDASRPV
ncbi:MAG: hypothetical protein EBR82_20015 [Caulobacteraceae bacterium]|nr:hypothetical protein [Caulobacteraceae bacterium]